jgi:hypothetical protein
MSGALQLSTRQNFIVGLLRYLLGLSMLPYAVSKMLKMQFIIFPFSTWQQSLEHLPGAAIAWAFLGYSEWFSILLGLFQAVPAVLLLFRRTYLLGAILMFPILLNVVLINYAMQLWLNTQMISLLLLTMNVVILLFRFRTLRSIWRLVSKPERFKRIKLEMGLNLSILAGTFVFLTLYFLNLKNDSNILTGDWYNKKHAVWHVDKVDSDSLSVLRLATYFKEKDILLFHPEHILEVCEGPYVRETLHYELQEDKKSIVIKDDEDQFQLNYSMEADILYLMAPLQNASFKIKLSRGFLNPFRN